MNYFRHALVLMVLLALSKTSFADEYLTCESQKGRRSYCDINPAQGAEVRLSRQLSDSPCDEGYTWGKDSRGVWVDRGCRAEFSVRWRDNSNNYGRDNREQCPPGFEPGNHRCTQGERQRGCKDLRMPGGTTCNSRGWS